MVRDRLELQKDNVADTQTGLPPSLLSYFDAHYSTSFLDLIGQALKQAGHVFVRIDGSMTTTRRIAAVSSFCSDDSTESSPRFILCSLHAAGTGINLTRGNHAFMMDCWWNQAIENQASKLCGIT